jgi:hypothetical protein
VTGEPLERIKTDLAERASNDEPSVYDITAPHGWPEYMAERMNVRRPSSEATAAAAAAGSSIWEFYGAPCLVLLAIDAALDPAYACFDAGLFAQTFCLAAEDRGFATCVMATAVRYADLLHAEIPEAAGKRFVVGIAFGFIDHTAVVNRNERNRVEIEEIATFVGDDEAAE